MFGRLSAGTAATAIVVGRGPVESGSTLAEKRKEPAVRAEWVELCKLQINTITVSS